MLKSILTLSLLIGTAFAADAPAPAPAVSGDLQAKILRAERDIISIGRQMDQKVKEYQDLQKQEAAAQQAMQDGMTEAYKAAGDPDKKKYDLSPDTLVFTPKPAPAPEKPLVPKN